MSGPTRTEYRKWRDSIIAERGKCEQCGRTEELVLHHIRPRASHPQLLMFRSNVRVLCMHCHGMAHGMSTRISSAVSE